RRHRRQRRHPAAQHLPRPSGRRGAGPGSHLAGSLAAAAAALAPVRAAGRAADPSLRESLAGPDSERRRFQLADRLARIYSRYMAYRPDWLAEWARGRAAFGEAGFHPAPWQALGRQVQEPHRGERLAELARRLRGDKLRLAASAPLHVFGPSHLAPAELAVLQALAVHRPVVFYLPDPCREYWGGLVSDRARLRALAEAPYGSEAETVFLQQHHPLLAAWGRLGQHFMLQMQS